MIGVKPKEKTKSKQARVKEKMERLEELHQKKAFFRIHWQVIAEYFFTRKASFTIQRVEGAFLNEELFDESGASAITKQASIVGSMC